MEYDFERDLLLVSLSNDSRIAVINVKTEETTYISVDDLYGKIKEMVLGERGIVFVKVGSGYGGIIHVVDVLEGKTLTV